MSCADCDTCTLEAKPMSGPNCHHEIHITVDPPEGYSSTEFAELGLSLGFRPLIMELVGPGNRRSQDWFTGGSFHGSDDAARLVLRSLGDDLEAAGLPPIRAKIEAAPWHYRAPIGHETGMDPNCYWESHVGVWVHEDEVTELGAYLRSLGGYLSVNLLKPGRDGGFVRASATCRSRNNTRNAQESSILMLRDIIRRQGQEVDTKTRTEFTWLDMAAEMDRIGGPPA